MLKPLALLAATLLGASPAWAAPAYTLTKTVPLGAPDRWDYAVFAPETGRVYVAHGDRVTVLDASSGAVVGQVEGMPGGTHGTAVSARAGQGFTVDGQKGEVAVFDLKTLKVIHRVPAAADADGVVRDPATGHVFVVEGDPGTITVVDPATDTAIATINAGEKMEYLAADDRGHVFVAGEAKSDLLRIDARTNAIVARWPTPDCKSPHGVAVDAAGGRVFMGCVNGVMMVIDARSGRVVAKPAIGMGSDAVAFDPVRKRVFSSNGREGTVSVYQQVSPDRYRALDPIQTAVSGRTMTLDPRTGRLFVIAADVDPSPTAGGRPRTRPGTLRVLIYDPIG